MSVEEMSRSDPAVSHFLIYRSMGTQLLVGGAIPGLLVPGSIRWGVEQAM